MTATPALPTRGAELRGGWRALCGSTVGLALGIASIPLYTNSVLFAAMEEDFGWSAASLSLVFLVANLLLAVCAPFCGRIVDRYGQRVPVLVSTLALGVSYLVLAVDPGSFGLYVTCQLVVYVAAGCSSAIGHARTVSGTFTRMRGLALGIMNTGPALMAIVLPPLLALVIGTDVLRPAYLFLGALVVVGSVVVHLLVPASAGRAAAPDDDVEGAERPGLLARRGILLRLVVAYFLMGVATIGLITHLFTLLLDAGVAESTVIWLLGSVGTAMLVIRLAVGALLDSFPPARVATVLMAGSAVGIAAVAVFGPGAAVITTLCLGIALGSETDVMAMLVARYFSRAQFGQAFGVGSLAFGLGVAAGPYVLSLVMDSTSSPGPTVLTASLLLLGSAVAFTSLPHARRHAADPAVLDAPASPSVVPL